MYSSGYSQVNKFSPEAQKKMQYRSKGKSCGYYMRIIFFFSSLIQSLIIVSLVLFLIYGNMHVSASSNPDQDLEKRFSQISIENVALQNQRKNLTNLLNATLTEKAKNDYDLAQLKSLVNRSIEIFKFQTMEMKNCEIELMKCRMTYMTTHTLAVQPRGDCNCGLLTEQMKIRLQSLDSNFTTTSRSMTLEREQIAKERDNQLLEAIRLRREKSILEKELDLFKQNSKNEFSQMLAPVSDVSKAFLVKIESLFPKHIAFQLTCAKQKEHLEQIHTNCTSLSHEVENKLQQYLNKVGEQVSDMQIENTRLKAENWRLSEDYREVVQNRTSILEQHKRSRAELQQKHDQEKERLLMDKMKLTSDNNLQLQRLKYNDLVIDDLKGKLNQLNMSCMARNTFGGYLGGGLGSMPSMNHFGTGLSDGGGSSYSPSSSSSLGQSRTGTVGSSPSQSSAGSGLNRTGSTGAGSASSTLSSYGSRSSPGNTGSTFNQAGPVGASSISSILQQPRSNPSLSVGSGINRPSSPGTFGSTLGSSGTQPDKLAESGKSLSSFGSSVGSLGSRLNQGSAGTGLNSPASWGKSSPGYGLASSSVSSRTGSSASKTSSSPSLSWLDFGLGSSNSGQSKTGSVPGKPSTGSGNVGTGPVFGGGRTSGQTGGSVVTKHIQDLQRFIDPPAPQEKQDLSRMLG
ncbi:plasmalemma vesicle-associated protein [Xiphophorus maculatus]|uniref:Plasmalemma vesicle associated protein a n=1 Tax=Xiphophorus maculatus TaxID=8083 RepID=M4AKK0_XIPMA|nr:plasmalemma vesicle-associated protein [Xiphophorus maculatus]XP_027876675.1 plasmalemma vesicle-associated protein-like [Xiphophorus couchianus]